MGRLAMRDGGQVLLSSQPLPVISKDVEIFFAGTLRSESRWASFPPLFQQLESQGTRAECP